MHLPVKIKMIFYRDTAITGFIVLHSCLVKYSNKTNIFAEVLLNTT